MNIRTVFRLMIVLLVIGVLSGLAGLWLWALTDASYEVTTALGVQSFAFSTIGLLGAVIVGMDL